MEAGTELSQWVWMSPSDTVQKPDQAPIYFLRQIASDIRARMEGGVEDYETILTSITERILKRAREMEAHNQKRHRYAVKRHEELSGLSNKIVERIYEMAALVSAHYKIDISAVTRARKVWAMMVPRYTVYWLCREAISYVRLADIGLTLHRDHSTIVYGINRVEEWRRTDPAYKATTDNLLSQVTRD